MGIDAINSLKSNLADLTYILFVLGKELELIIENSEDKKVNENLAVFGFYKIFRHNRFLLLEKYKRKRHLIKSPGLKKRQNGDILCSGYMLCPGRNAGDDSYYL